MTVCVTVERFIVVYLPLKSRSWCTTRRATWASVIISVLCVIYNIPTWWEYHYENKYLNGTLIGYTLELTEFRKNQAYVLYYITWGSFFLYRMIPFSILVVLNVIIYMKVTSEPRVCHFAWHYGLISCRFARPIKRESS